MDHGDVSPRGLRHESPTSVENRFAFQARGRVKCLSFLQVVCQGSIFGNLKVPKFSLKIIVAFSVREKKINTWNTSVWQLLEANHSISTTHPFCPWDLLCLASSRKTLLMLQTGETWGQFWSSQSCLCSWAQLAPMAIEKDKSRRMFLWSNEVHTQNSWDLGV